MTKADRTTKILFDAGVTPDGLVENMRRLELNPRDIDIIVLSHGHWDHTTGMDGGPEQRETERQTLLGCGSWPICVSRLMTSTISHSSSILPSRHRLIVRPVNSTSWSVTCRPRMVNRVAT
jgi:mRNA degradation ribonuclease J1/J2